VVEGIDHAVDAFLGLFDGKNTGKMVVKLAEPTAGRGIPYPVHANSNRISPEKK
jgi:hypothetical protein